VETGHYKPLIDKQFTLDNIVEAYKYVEKRQKIVSVIISITEYIIYNKSS